MVTLKLFWKTVKNLLKTKLLFILIVLTKNVISLSVYQKAPNEVSYGQIVNPFNVRVDWLPKWVTSFLKMIKTVLRGRPLVSTEETPTSETKPKLIILSAILAKKRLIWSAIISTDRTSILIPRLKAVRVELMTTKHSNLLLVFRVDFLKANWALISKA